MDGAERQRLSWPMAWENLRLVSPVATSSKVTKDRKSRGTLVGDRCVICFEGLRAMPDARGDEVVRKGRNLSWLTGERWRKPERIWILGLEAGRTRRWR